MPTVILHSSPTQTLCNPYYVGSVDLSNLGGPHTFAGRIAVEGGTSALERQKVSTRLVRGPDVVRPGREAERRGPEVRLPIIHELGSDLVFQELVDLFLHLESFHFEWVSEIVESRLKHDGLVWWTARKRRRGDKWGRSGGMVKLERACGCITYFAIALNIRPSQRRMGAIESFVLHYMRKLME